MKRVFFAVLTLIAFGASAQHPLSFIACGDMPYHNPADIERFKRLIVEVNKFKPAFSVHVGDIKTGSTPCTDVYMESIKDLFMSFEGPLLYTPGDNEWTDCDRPSAGGHIPMERLEKVRSLFYDGKQSMGKHPLKTFNQNQLKGFPKYVENQYWEMEKISFGTFHAVGTNNNLVVNRARAEEFFERDSANTTWIDYIFDQAEKNNNDAVVLFTQADMNFDAMIYSGYFSIINKLRQRVKKFNKPVLLVYGDSHRLRVDKPLKDENGVLMNNFTTVMVFGDLSIHGVRIDIDKSRKSIFAISEFWVDGN